MLLTIALNNMSNKRTQTENIGEVQDNTDFCMTWELLDSTCVQNAPTECGGNFHTGKPTSENSCFGIVDQGIRFGCVGSGYLDNNPVLPSTAKGLHQQVSMDSQRLSQNYLVRAK